MLMQLVKQSCFAFLAHYLLVHRLERRLAHGLDVGRVAAIPVAPGVVLDVLAVAEGDKKNHAYWRIVLMLFCCYYLGFPLCLLGLSLEST